MIQIRATIHGNHLNGQKTLSWSIEGSAHLVTGWDYMRLIVSRRNAIFYAEWLLLSLGILAWICALVAGLSISQRYLRKLIPNKNGTNSGIWRGRFS